MTIQHTKYKNNKSYDNFDVHLYSKVQKGFKINLAYLVFLRARKDYSCFNY